MAALKIASGPATWLRATWTWSAEPQGIEKDQKRTIFPVPSIHLFESLSAGVTARHEVPTLPWFTWCLGSPPGMGFPLFPGLLSAWDPRQVWGPHYSPSSSSCFFSQTEMLKFQGQFYSSLQEVISPFTHHKPSEIVKTCFLTKNSG